MTMGQAYEDGQRVFSFVMDGETFTFEPKPDADGLMPFSRPWYERQIERKLAVLAAAGYSSRETVAPWLTGRGELVDGEWAARLEGQTVVVNTAATPWAKSYDLEQILKSLDLMGEYVKTLMPQAATACN